MKSLDWLESDDHRTISFVNRSSEWVVLEGKLQIGKNRHMTSTAKIPPKATFYHLFLGETFDAEWDSTNNVDLLVFFPEPYWFCFNGGYTWTCSTIADPCSSKKEARQCRLNGKAVLKLNEDLGAKMRPLDSRTVFIDVKFVSSLQSITTSKILESFKPQDTISNSDIPLHLSEQLRHLSNIRMTTPLKNY